MILPMHKHCTAGVQSILDEPCAGREVLDEVLVVHIIDFDDLVAVAFE